VRGNQKNKDFKVKWSPHFAYSIGLIATDGCLYNDGRHISLTSKDVELLITFKKCLGLTNKIALKGGITQKKNVLMFSLVTADYTGGFRRLG